MLQRMCAVILFVVALLISVIPNADAPIMVIIGTWIVIPLIAVNRTACFILRCIP